MWPELAGKDVSGAWYVCWLAAASLKISVLSTTYGSALSHFVQSGVHDCYRSQCVWCSSLFTLFPLFVLGCFPTMGLRVETQTHPSGGSPAAASSTLLPTPPPWPTFPTVLGAGTLPHPPGKLLQQAWGQRSNVKFQLTSSMALGTKIPSSAALNAVQLITPCISTSR